MRTGIAVLMLLAVMLGGCSKKTMMPNDRRVYGSPAEQEVAYEAVSFASDLNGTIRGWWLESSMEPKRGTCVLVPGVRHNISYHYRDWLWLLNAGYDVLLFDYRGYGASTGEGSLPGYIADTRAALLYAQRQGSGGVVAIGQSMGGAILINALEAEQPEGLRLAVVDSSFGRFYEISRDMMARSAVMWPLQWLPSFITPRDYDAADKIAGVRIPLLFIASGNDRSVSPDYSFELFMRATASRELWFVEGSPHIRAFARDDVRQAFIQTLSEEPEVFASHFSAILMFGSVENLVKLEKLNGTGK